MFAPDIKHRSQQAITARVIAILRHRDPDLFPAVIATLLGAGITTVEIALTTPGALAAIRLAAETSAPGLHLGAGTVLSAADADAAVTAGARYLVTPAVRPDVLRAAAGLGVPVVCGAYTATEILTAVDLGASAVKIFPAATGGPSYLRSLREPLPHIPMIPTGGVTTSDISAYLAAGADAVGLGRSLIGDACAGESLDALAARAAEVIAVVSGLDAAA